MIKATKSVILNPDTTYPLYITAKCYAPTNSERSSGSEALTLILLHSTSFHKETWEPFIEDLFQFVVQSGRPFIREAWVIECPNHGESAVLNEKLLLRQEFHNNFTCEKYALAAHRFLAASPKLGAEVDFRTRNLVGIGHSLGGVAMTILQSVQPRIEFRTIILVEPMLSPGGWERLSSLQKRLVQSARKRQDTWTSRQGALSTFKRGKITRQWDPRTIEAFVKYGIREKLEDKNEGRSKIYYVLSCTRDQEAGMYEETEGPWKAVPFLNETCRRIPVHIIYGAIKDSSGIPRSVQEAVLDPKFRHFASIDDIRGVGHLIPQEKPRDLAEKVFKILSVSRLGSIPRPKL